MIVHESTELGRIDDLARPPRPRPLRPRPRPRPRPNYGGRTWGRGYGYGYPVYVEEPGPTPGCTRLLKAPSDVERQAWASRGYGIQKVLGGASGTIAYFACPFGVPAPALAGHFDRKLGPVVIVSSPAAEQEVMDRYPGQRPMFVERFQGLEEGIF